MRDIIEDFYYGSVASASHEIALNLQPRRKALHPYMERITETLGLDFADEFFDLAVGLTQQEALETFRAGVRLGVEIAKL